MLFRSEKALESSSEPLARAERRWGNVEGWGMYEGPEPGGAERRMDEDEDEGAGVVKMKVRVWLLDDVDAVVQKVFSRLVYRLFIYLFYLFILQRGASESRAGARGSLPSLSESIPSTVSYR